MESQGPDIASIVRALRQADIDALVLRGDRIEGDAPVFRPVQVLVPTGQRKEAVAVFEPMAWRYSWIHRGLMRLMPGMVYAWDGGHVVELFWSLPAAPMPASVLRRLTASMWRSAQRGVEKFRTPDAPALLVHLAVQSCRPGRASVGDWEDFVTLRRSIGDLEPARAIARAAGVEPALDRAIAAAAASENRPGPGRTYQGAWDVARRLANAVQARVRPRRLGRLLAGAPLYGDAEIRCRVAGVEVRAGPGVFVPAPSAELFVESAVAAVSAVSRPLIVEAGTGCGAIALALARAMPDAHVHATELSARAVRWARRNARRTAGVHVEFYGGSLLEPLPSSLHGRVDLVLANLPYLPEREEFTVGSLPSSTITGAGDDGLGLHRRLAKAATRFLRPGGHLQLQMLAWQWPLLSAELAELGYRPGAPRFSGAFAICPAELVKGLTLS